MKEMKTLTMGGNTYEIVDAAAREQIKDLNSIPYIVSDMEPENTNLFWIDSSVEGDHILKYYNTSEGAWLPIRIAWG